MSNKLLPYLFLSDVLKRLKETRETAGAGDLPLLMADKHHPAVVPCTLSLGKGGAGNVYKKVSRGGVPVVLATRGSKGDAILSLDGAIEALERYKTELGTDDTPFLAEASPYPDFQLCDIWKQSVGASNIFRRVSRGGRDVLVVELTVPNKD
jgi:hypothetical protein